MKDSNTLAKKHKATIKALCNKNITEQNYKDLILGLYAEDSVERNYFKTYMETYKESIDFLWGCLMYLFEASIDQPLIYNYYEKLRAYPDNYYIELEMGKYELRSKGNFFLGKLHYLKSLKIFNEDPRLHYDLGFLYSILNVHDKSRYHYETAVDLGKNKYGFERYKDLTARSLFNLATFKINIDNDYKEAKILVKAALSEMNDYPQAKALLENIESVLGGGEKWLNIMKKNLLK